MLYPTNTLADHQKSIKIRPKWENRDGCLAWSPEQSEGEGRTSSESFADLNNDLVSKVKWILINTSLLLRSLFH